MALLIHDYYMPCEDRTRDEQLDVLDIKAAHYFVGRTRANGTSSLI